MQTDPKLKPSRTKKKKHALALQSMGEELIALNDSQLTQLHLPQELLDAVRMARGIRQNEARRRQLQYIGSLMRGVEDTESIRQVLERLSFGDREEVKRFKQIEQMRDRLIGGDDQLLQQLSMALPGIDSQELTLLVQEARGHKQDARRQKLNRQGPVAARKLFRFLRQLTPR